MYFEIPTFLHMKRIAKKTEGWEIAKILLRWRYSFQGGCGKLIYEEE